MIGANQINLQAISDAEFQTNIAMWIRTMYVILQMGYMHVQGAITIPHKVNYIVSGKIELNTPNEVLQITRPLQEISFL